MAARHGLFRREPRIKRIPRIRRLGFDFLLHSLDSFDSWFHCLFYKPCRAPFSYGRHDFFLPPHESPVMIFNHSFEVT